MAILYQCCCWGNVRSGSLAAAIYTIILSLVCGGLMGYSILHQHQHQTNDSYYPEAEGLYISVLIIYILEFATSILLIFGIHKDDKNLLIPWLCSSVSMVIMDTVVLIFQCVVLGWLTLNIVYMVIWLGVTFLNVYCILCVISQYQELRVGRGTSEYIRNQRLSIMYRSGIQQVHITQGPIVMSCPGTLTAATSVQQSTQPGVSATITTTVMMAPPDYNVAVGQPPRYTTDELSRAEGSSTTEPLLLTEKKEKETPPPYMP